MLHVSEKTQMISAVEHGRQSEEDAEVWKGIVVLLTLEGLKRYRL